MNEIDLDALAPWLGRTETKEDVLTHGLIDKFRAAFGPHLWGGAGDVPLGVHWCIALDTVPAATPLTIGEAVTRRSVIGDITAKQGRSGTLVFVTVEHEYSSGGRLCIREKQSIVYREISVPRPVKNAPAAVDPTTLRSSLAPDPVLLFRYSALTFNAHRIHYDHVYATETEAYAGLVVHGPLQATLLLNLAAEALKSSPHRFSFRGLAPLTLPCELQLHSEGAENSGTVWCQDQTGLRSFTAEYATV